MSFVVLAIALGRKIAATNPDKALAYAEFPLSNDVEWKWLETGGKKALGIFSITI